MAKLRSSETRSAVAHSAFLLQMQSALHDLCQPVTALQFRLENAKMLGGHEALQQAVDDSLGETARLFTVIAQMRGYLLHQEALKSSSK